MCDHVTKLQLIRDIRDGLCGSFWEPSSRKQLVNHLPLCPFLHSAAWNVNVMTGALAAILDPKNKGLFLGKVSGEKLESLRTSH